MKDLFLRKKIAILSVIAMIGYLWMLFSASSNGWEDFMMGFRGGAGVDGYESHEGLVWGSSFDVFYVKVKPVENVLLFPEQVQVENGGTVDVRFEQMKIALPSSFVEKAKIGVMEIFQGCFFLAMFLLYVFLPIWFFRLVSFLKSGILFDRRNVRLIQQMGWMMIGLYLCDYLSEYLSWKINLALFDFEDYAIVQIASDPLLFVIGVVALLLAEIFARGVLLEEEQELTI